MVIQFFITRRRGAVGGQQGYMAKSRTRHGARTVHVPLRLAHHYGRRSRDLAAIPRGVVHAGQPAIVPRRARGIPPRCVRNPGQSRARRALKVVYSSACRSTSAGVASTARGGTIRGARTAASASLSSAIAGDHGRSIPLGLAAPTTNPPRL